jgi:hypothetical protein
MTIDLAAMQKSAAASASATAPASASGQEPEPEPEMGPGARADSAAPAAKKCALTPTSVESLDDKRRRSRGKKRREQGHRRSGTWRRS